MKPLTHHDDIVVYKKAVYRPKHFSYQPAIITLMIPAQALRVKHPSGKCRSSSAKVLNIEVPALGIKSAKAAYSIYDRDFVYKQGKTVRPKKKINCSHVIDCASGIHWFYDRSLAETY